MLNEAVLAVPFYQPFSQPTNIGTNGQALLSDGQGGSVWGDVSSSGGGAGLPDGGNIGQILVNVSSGSASWQDVPTELPSGGSADQLLTLDSSGNEVWGYVANSGIRYLAIYANGHGGSTGSHITELDLLDYNGEQIDYTPSIASGTCGSGTNISLGALDDDDTAQAPYCQFGSGGRSRLVLDLGGLISNIYSVRLTMFNDGRTYEDVAVYVDVTNSFAAAATPGSNTLIPVMSERDVVTVNNAVGEVFNLPQFVAGGGSGLPTGGTTGQVLTLGSGGNAQWTDAAT